MADAGPDALLRVLVVDDEPQYAAFLREHLEGLGHHVETATTPEAGLTRALAGDMDVLLLDLSMPRMDGLAFLRRLPLNDRPEIVVLSGAISLASAVEAVKLGATDCLLKSGHLAELERAVRKAGAARRLRPRPASEAERDTRSKIVTQDPRMLEILSVLERVADSNASVLLTGESGTGKDLLARHVHCCSPRAAGPFVDVNCAALSDSLLEAELFGHERGAFTGATSTQPGLAESAHGGTLFLDEVTEMDPAPQAKLLRMTEDRTLYRVGGRQRIHVDIRIIAATNRDLTRVISDGRLREDLYYRLAGVEISVPPLRERPNDVPLLAEHYLRAAARRAGRGPTAIGSSAMEALRAHRWPGNVRELRNVMERLALLVRASAVELQHLDPMLRGRLPAATHGRSGGPSLKDLERDHIGRVLAEEGWHHERAAGRLGMPLRTLYRRIKAYKLRREGEADGQTDTIRMP